MSKTKIQAGRRTVEISRPEKLLFPADGISKGDLVDYYRAVAARMVPHLRGRPLMLERHPDGIEGPGFMQKEVPDHFPDWIDRAELPKEAGTVTHVLCDDRASLIYLANQGCITPHRWLSKADRPDHPDRVVFDLDPADEGFAPVRQAAHWLHELLEELSLPSLPMTTGSRGIHIIVPLDRKAPFEEVRGFARDLAEKLSSRHPDQLTTAPRKEARKGRLYLDVQRNGYAQTAVAPYAVRARAGAPVAAPMEWGELDDPALGARRWTLTMVEDLLKRDPWSNAPRGRSLAVARRRLAEI
ncbi:non-homologous end-joining DNA ligase [Streptomyces avidinii]|uniref:Bifunctional non-homologous end joining protein LigD n=1 Tax=Streptomyces avidinii TaxID=1895 RepID=A0ABS4KXT1_STRAV|nr:non-homologous end-joining DNA ligase [Streptomyces avidinii]MBP2034848.1 bifunctional non-homologous end joining protein LigD [Streptomyces avidinii]